MNMKKTKSDDKKILEIPAVYVSRVHYGDTIIYGQEEKCVIQLVSNKYRYIYDSHTTYVCNTGTCTIGNWGKSPVYRVYGMENDQVFLQFNVDCVKMKLKEFKRFLSYIQSICGDYVSARTKYINAIEELSEFLYNSEPGIIAKNLLSSTSQDVWLQPDSVVQLDALILRDAFDVDFIINDSFSISSQLIRGIYLEDYRVKTQRVEMKRLEKRRKENIQGLFNGHYLKKATQEYRKFFDAYEIPFQVREDIISYYKNYFLKFIEYLDKYYSAEIKQIEKKFFYENEKGESIYLSAPTVVYVAYSILKRGLFSVAEEKFAGRINFIKNKSISYYAEALSDSFDNGFVNSHIMGMYVLSLMKHNVFKSSDYISNFKKFEEIFGKICKENGVEDFRKKYASIDAKRIYTLSDIDLMTGLEFENFLCDLFQNMGYLAQVTKSSGDQGIDIIAEKNGQKIGIQAKCYSGVVGNSAIQEAVAGKSFYSCDKVMVITNSHFTKAAIALAKTNDVILWDRDMLKENI